MDDFPGNSHASRKEKQPPPQKKAPGKIERVTTSDVIQRRKPLGKQFAETFVLGSVKDALAYVVQDVLIPYVKDMMLDGINEGSRRVILRDGAGTRSARRRFSDRPSGPGGVVNYNGFASGGSRREPAGSDVSGRRSRSSHEIDEVILVSRVEAEEVRTKLFDLISQYEVATVQNLNDMLGLGSSHVDQKWGWTDIRPATIHRVRGGEGYLLELPDPIHLDD